MRPSHPPTAEPSAMTKKPTENEDEYFARLDFEKKKAIAAKRAQDMAEDERRKLKDLHFMHCPKDGHDLVAITLHGVQVERCPSCEGMWEDKGELDQLVKNDDSGLFKRIVGIFG